MSGESRGGALARLTKLTEQETRKLWPREEQDLSPWVRDNIDYLNEAIGLQVEIADAEIPVGPFRLDLAGMDSLTQRPVVIENQFGQSDHDHLGKLITYAAHQEAGVLIWIAMDFQERHRAAINWLNSVTSRDLVFYGVELGVFVIGGSAPAPKFDIVAAPSGDKVPKPPASDVSPRGREYQAFWTKFLEHVRKQYPGLTRAQVPGTQNWFSTGIGLSSFSIGATFTGDGYFRVELYIDSGNMEENTRAFNALKESQNAIHSELGETLTWDELPDRRACRIYLPRMGVVGDGEESLDAYIAWAADWMAKFKETFRPVLTRLALA